MENLPNCLSKINEGTFKKSDRLIIFYREICHRKILNSLNEIIDYNCKHVSYVEILAHTKNALDFSLTACVGSILGKFRGRHLDIIIVSKDNGYKGLIDFLSYIKSKLSYTVSLSFRCDLPCNNNKQYYCMLDIIANLCYDETLVEKLNVELDRYYRKHCRLHFCGLIEYLLDSCYSRRDIHNTLNSLFGMDGTDLYRWMKTRYIC